MAETETPAPPDDGDDPRTASATPTTWPARSPPRDHHRPAEAPEHQRGGDTRRGINPEPIPSGGVTRWTAQARQDRVPRRAADLMDKRARPRSKRPRPRSGRGVRCSRHPCRQASLRVSPRRGAGRPHPSALGARSVIHCVQHPAGRVPPGWVRFTSQAPARFAPELSQARQDRPRPVGRTSGPRRLSGPFLGGWWRQCPPLFDADLSKLVYSCSPSTIQPTFIWPAPPVFSR